MKRLQIMLVGLALSFALSACGGGGESEEDVLAELKDQGFSDSLAGCVLDEIKDKAGSLDEYGDLGSSDQQEMAATAGASCAGDASEEDLTGAVEGLDAELDDPALRDSIITGMTSQGVTEEVANCILDAAIEKDYSPTDFIDEAKIVPLAQACQ